ncbi:putative ribonuclease H-like domain-containing protein [Tanacetum coccineum]
MTHPHPQRNFVPRAVLIKSSLKTLNTTRQNSSKAAVSVNTSRPINSASPRPTVNCTRPASNVINKAHSHVNRPFNKFTTKKKSNFNEKVNTVRGNVTTIGPKAVGNPQLELKEKGIIDSRCSRHMTGNMSYLSDYKEINGGYVAFGGDTKRGKITGKDFKLTDESHVLLKVPRKDNMYSVNLKNVVPQGGVTCFFAKTTPYESNFGHRRLGYVNFKTINKLVKGNLVRGRKPALGFMRPFGCPVTILNTIDHLSKFDGKADEGFFVGYSTNSKAFRVFNSRTRIVEENMHVKFIFAGNQSNGSVGKKACDDALKARMETVPGKDYILLPFLTQDLSLSFSSKDSPGAGFKPLGEEEKKDAKDQNEDSNVPNTEEPRVNQEQDESINNTNNINTVSSTVNTASIKDNDVDQNIVYGCIDDPNMPNLEEIVYSNDDEEVGAEADLGTICYNGLAVLFLYYQEFTRIIQLNKSLEIYIQHLKPEE